MTSHPSLRPATAYVLVAVAVIGGATLFLGDRFNPGPGYAPTQTVQAGVVPIAACVAEENMRLITLGRERCQAGELELAAKEPAPGRPDARRDSADGVSGFEIVTARTAVAARQSAGGEVRCPTDKVAVGGGLVPDPDTNDPDTNRLAGVDKLDLVTSGPLLPTENGSSGWTFTVRNRGSGPLSVVVAAVCVMLR